MDVVDSLTFNFEWVCFLVLYPDDASREFTEYIFLLNIYIFIYMYIKYRYNHLYSEMK